MSLVWMPVAAGEKPTVEAAPERQAPVADLRPSFSSIGHEAVLSVSMAMTQAIRWCRSWREIVSRRFEW